MSAGRASLIGALATVTLVAAGCTTAGEGAPGEGTGPATLVFGASIEPTTYDYMTSDSLDIHSLLMYNVVETVLESDASGEVTPLLAESVDTSDDGLVTTITLREAQFHDGSPLTADDLVYSLEQHRAAANPLVSGPLSPVETIELVDDRTVEVSLSAPSQQFLMGLAGPAGYVIPEGSAEQLAQAPVGTGPFTFDGWDIGSQVELRRFEDYWGEAPEFEGITWRFIPDTAARTSAMLSGDIDVMPEGVAADSTDRFEASGETTVVSFDAKPIFALVLSAGHGAFDDERVRQAIAHALDRDSLVAANPPAEVACTNVNPPTVAWASLNCPYGYDPAAAERLLAAAGAEGLSVALTIPEFLGTLAEVIQAQLDDAGITLTIDSVDLAGWLDRATSGNFEATIFAGSQQLDAWVCPGFWSHDCDADFDSLLAEADESLDRGTWAELRSQAVDRQAERAYVIPLYTVPQLVAVPSDLAGVKTERAFVEWDLRALSWAG